MLQIQFCAPDDGWRNHPKHVEHFTEINKLCNLASCWLYFGRFREKLHVAYILEDVIQWQWKWSKHVDSMVGYSFARPYPGENEIKMGRPKSGSR